MLLQSVGIFNSNESHYWLIESALSNTSVLIRSEHVNHKQHFLTVNIIQVNMFLLLLKTLTPAWVIIDIFREIFFKQYCFPCDHCYIVCKFLCILSSHLLRQKVSGDAQMNIWMIKQRIVVMCDIGYFNEEEHMYKISAILQQLEWTIELCSQT